MAKNNLEIYRGGGWLAICGVRVNGLWTRGRTQ